MSIKRTRNDKPIFSQTKNSPHRENLHQKNRVNIYRNYGLKTQLKNSSVLPPTNPPLVKSPLKSRKNPPSSQPKRRGFLPFGKEKGKSSNKDETKVLAHGFLDLEGGSETIAPPKLTAVSDTRVIRKNITEGTSLDNLPIMDRIVLGFKTYAKLNNRDEIAREKAKLAQIQKEQTYYQTIKHFVQTETDIFYTDASLSEVVLQIDRKFSPYLPKLREDLSYLNFREQPPTKDMLLSYRDIPHLFFISLKKF